jgi:putative membrane protein
MKLHYQKALYMAQQKDEINVSTEVQNVPLPRHVGVSKRVTDHLANQRTFLAWIRTGLATITFGFVVERFGLLVRELGLKVGLTVAIPAHYSSFFGVSLTVLGVIMMIVALVEFLQIRRSIDLERFHPPATFSIILTILATLIGSLLAIYLLLTG